jgi:hypothetical protein
MDSAAFAENPVVISPAIRWKTPFRLESWMDGSFSASFADPFHERVAEHLPRDVHLLQEF